MMYFVNACFMHVFQSYRKKNNTLNHMGDDASCLSLIIFSFI